MVKKKTGSAVPNRAAGVKSVTLGDMRAAEAQSGVKAVASRSGTTEAKELDKDMKDFDRKEKTASSKELDKRAKEADKVDKMQNP